MTLRLHTFLAGLLALLMAGLLALAPVAAKPASGGYQLFSGAVSGHQAAISLASLGNFNYHAKIAPECCNAPKRTSGLLVGDSYVPSGGDVVRNGTVQLDRTITTKTGRKIPAGSVVTENGGAIKIVTPDGPTITDKTDSLLGPQQLKLPPPAAKGTLPSTYTRNADGTITGPGNLSGQKAVFPETGETDAIGNSILQRESGGYFTVNSTGKQQRISARDLPQALQSKGKTPWQQSQAYIQRQVGGGEKSYSVTTLF